MFLHVFKYRLVTLIKAKSDIFWSMIFPIVLVTCFSLAFSDLDKAAFEFHSIPVAVVYENENIYFQKTLEAVAENTNNGEEFLKITITDAAYAQQLLDSKEVTAIITVGDSVGVTVAATGINETAVVSFVNEYIQKEALIKEVLTADSNAAERLFESLGNTQNYIKDASLGDKDFGIATGYYFSLIAMAALFGGYLGMNCARNIRADGSPIGMRKCISSLKREKMIAAEFLATYLTHIISLAILLLYMICILKVDNLADYMGYVILTCLTGSLTGIAGGFFIASIPGLKDGSQDAIYTVYSLGSSFLAGLMSYEMKIIVAQKAPFIAKINPATLIQDSLYSLAVYDTHTRYYENMIILAAIALLLLVASYMMTRRKSYASL